jgi:hypothetical protein
LRFILVNERWVVGEWSGYVDGGGIERMLKGVCGEHRWSVLGRDGKEGWERGMYEGCGGGFGRAVS